LTGPGTWFSAKKVCVHYVTNEVSAKNGRIIQFNGGLMTKDAFKGKVPVIVSLGQRLEKIGNRAGTVGLA